MPLLGPSEAPPKPLSVVASQALALLFPYLVFVLGFLIAAYRDVRVRDRGISEYTPWLVGLYSLWYTGYALVSIHGGRTGSGFVFSLFLVVLGALMVGYGCLALVDGIANVLEGAGVIR